MKQRKFGSRSVSEVGLGTWQLGSADWGAVDDSAAEAVLETALDAGVTFLDTSDVYGSGLSEKRIGNVLTRMPARLRPMVATKLGRAGEPGWPQNFTYEAMRRHTEDSRERLRVDRLDLTQLHCLPHEVLREGEVFEHLRRLQSDGLIAAFGASVESMDEALTCLDVQGLASLQIIFNVFRQKPIDVLFERAKAQGVALIVRLPLASGLLSGRMTKSTSFAPSDHRTYNRDGQAFNAGETFAGLPFEKGVELVDELKTLLASDVPLAQVALRYCLDFDAVTTVIPGGRTAEQVLSNVAASELPPLSAEVHARLRDFYQARVHNLIRGAY